MSLPGGTNPSWPSSHSLSVAAAIQRALYRQSQGDYVSAEQEYRAVIQRMPRSPRALYGLGVCLDLMGRREEALVAFAESVRLDGGFGPSRVALGAAYVSAGRYRRAIAHLVRALELVPEDVNAYLWASDAHNALGDVDSAARMLALGRARCKPERSALFLRSLAALATEAGDAVKAKAYLDEAEGLQPASPWLHLRFAEYWRSIGDLSLALREVLAASVTEELSIDDVLPERLLIAVAADDVGALDLADLVLVRNPTVRQLDGLLADIQKMNEHVNRGSLAHKIAVRLRAARPKQQ